MPLVGQEFHIAASNLDSSIERIKLGKRLADRMRELLSDYANEVSSKSKAEISSHSHPSNLYRNLRRNPDYGVKSVSPFYYKVATPGGKWGLAGAVTEVATDSHSKQGAALISQLDIEYGKKKGRVMYAAFDSLAPEYEKRHRQLVEDIESEVNRTTE